MAWSASTATGSSCSTWAGWCRPRVDRLASMPRDANIPDAFDVYTLVLLRRPHDAPQFSEAELDDLQSRHLAYRAELRRQGVLVVNGPLGEQSDISLRGL